MSDDELREWCITNYGTPEVSECEKCPNQKECDDFMERHTLIHLYLADCKSCPSGLTGERF